MMKNKIRNFFYGRYGQDALNEFLLIAYIVLLLVNIVMDSDIIGLLMLFLVVVLTYRMMSRNYSARRKENASYLQLIRPWKRRFKIIKLNLTDREHRYYICPKCQQICRVQRMNRKGTITCPKCLNVFKGRG